MRFATALLSTFSSNLSSLLVCPRELWLTYIVKALESYSYFSMSLIYVLYLTDNFGVDDIAAGGSYGVWGMLIVLWGVLLGPVIDYLGIRLSLLLCFALEAVTRMVMATTTSLPIIYLMLYTVLPAAGALGVPVMTIGIKRYSTVESRGFAYGLFYTVMNVAALANGLLVDFLRIRLCDGFAIKSLPPDHWLNDGNRLVVASGALTSVMGLVISFCFRADEPVRTGISAIVTAVSLDQPEVAASPLSGAQEPDLPQPSGHLVGATTTRYRLPGRRVCHLIQTVIADIGKSIGELGAYPGFWKYITMAVFLLNLRQTFRYLDSMLPKYMERSMGCDAPIGSVYAINPGMIIVLVPLVTAATSKVRHFDMIHFGAYISATSPFWAYFFTEPDWLGPVLFVVQLSLGEAIWSPRWYDYTMDVAPDKREGIFGAIAGAPLFLAKLPSGILSGFLLERFCPEGKGCRAAEKAACRAAAVPTADVPPSGAAQPPTSGGCSSVLWLIVGFVTVASPLLVSMFQRWLRPGPPGSGNSQYRMIQLEEAGNINNHSSPDEDFDSASRRRAFRLPAVPEGYEDIKVERDEC